jgi:hypothetical protein
MLTPQEQTAVRNIITREGSVGAVLDQVRALSIADKKAAALTALGGAISVTVTNWQAIAQHVAQARHDTNLAAALPSVIQDITAAATAQDQSKLGPLLVQLFAAAKARLGQ